MVTISRIFTDTFTGIAPASIPYFLTGQIIAVFVAHFIYKTFVKNFNDKYKDSLLEEQKEIITRRAISFSDNGVSLKVFLNEEVMRLKKCLKKSLGADVMREDNNMANKTSEVLAILESYKEKQVIDNDAIIQLLEIQSLARELEE